jgi:dTDP-glucose 4,6-dehydratase
MGVEVEIVGDDQRLRPQKSEVERLWASNEKAGRLLNWSPQYGGLDGFRRGLSASIDWFTQPDNLHRYKVDIYNL